MAMVAGLSTASATFAGYYQLTVEQSTVNVTGRERPAVSINGSIPGPLLQWREGEDVVVDVTNALREPTAIHWHGILLPGAMDGVPGLGFEAIEPGTTYTYRFRLRQSGTYWYHSHADLQEQSGMYAPIVIQPARPNPKLATPRDYVVMLSDWTDEAPQAVYAKLKKQSGYYNFQKRSAIDFIHGVGTDGMLATIKDWLSWNEMRMDPTDLSDVTGYTYRFLVNGRTAEQNWTGVFTPGERIRLRLINASAMTYFDVRIPGLRMTVVQSDGQDVQPVVVDELRLAVAETYDVIVEPTADQAYTLYAESLDRSGFTRATLAPQLGMTAPLPERRSRPLLTMVDMGMHHAGMHHGAHVPDTPAPVSPVQQKMFHHDAANTHGPGNDMTAQMPRNRLHEPGVGLDGRERRVLVYTDLRSRQAHDERPPTRDIDLHLTGNMQRFMWSFDGRKYSEVEPINVRLGERLRFTLTNDTMMNHPIHLHGLWSELENGAGDHRPLKHVINVKPAERLSFYVNADAPGEWAFHCHLLYHMEAGMFRKIRVIGSETVDTAHDRH